ncbi:uncharacterized protein [Diabrotica undecimpunctata]|uniref:uncharacterized protein n=1 Tax=Diabrotica undecimpunctata TaxID=50387 RepID=UPI003B63E18F
MKQWLHSKDIHFDDDMLKVKRLQLVVPLKIDFNKRVVDEMTREQNKTVLRLPPYYCELNPIELIWPDAKNFVAADNKTSKFADVKNLFDETVSKNCVEYVKNTVEKKFWGLDNVMEVIVELLIIEVGANSESDNCSYSLSV